MTLDFDLVFLDWTWFGFVWMVGFWIWFFCPVRTGGLGLVLFGWLDSDLVFLDWTWFGFVWMFGF